MICTAVSEKAHLGGKVTPSNEEIKPVALFIIELCLAEGIS